MDKAGRATTTAAGSSTTTSTQPNEESAAPPYENTAAANAYTSGTTTTTQTAEHQSLGGGVDANTLFELEPAPAYSPPSTMTTAIRPSKPVAIPQLAKGAVSPFLRAWAPELEGFGVTREKWLEFIDGLSFSMASSLALAPLQAIGRIAAALPVISSAGTVLQAGLRRGDASLSAGSSERFVSRANRGYFLPRGLQVELLSGRELRDLLGVATDENMMNSGPSTAANALETFTKNVRLPIVSGIARGVLKVVKPVASAGSSSTGPTQSTTSSSAERELTECDFPTRRLASLAGHVATLQIDNLPTSTLEVKLGSNAWSSYSTRVGVEEARAKDVYARHTASLCAVGRGELSAAQWTMQHQGQYGRDYHELQYEQRDAQRAQDAQRNFDRYGRDEELEREAEREARKEMDAANRAVWLVVRTLQESSSRRMVRVPDEVQTHASTSAAAAGSSKDYGNDRKVS